MQFHLRVGLESRVHVSYREVSGILHPATITNKSSEVTYQTTFLMVLLLELEAYLLETTSSSRLFSYIESNASQLIWRHDKELH